MIYLALQKAGLYTAQLELLIVQQWNSKLLKLGLYQQDNITIQQDDDPEDGFGWGSKNSKRLYVYYLSGNPSSLGKTKYLFIADSLMEYQILIYIEEHLLPLSTN